jgi:hypothetical protein
MPKGEATHGLRMPFDGSDEGFKVPKELLPKKRRHRSLSSDICLSKEHESKRVFFFDTELSKEEAKIEEDPEMVVVLEKKTKLELMAAHPRSISSKSTV